jgi:hypothetical protein
MEKLELKHLAPYLPYELKVKLNSELYQYPTIIGMVRDTIYLNYHGKGLSFILNNVKPILRPLSDIKNFEDIMDEFSIRSYEAFENHFFDRVLGRSLNCFDNVNYTIIELCFKHHLDIFDLIPKGLAISYSDVQSTSNEG